MRKPGGGPKLTNMTVIGGGSGTLIVKMDFLSNKTVVFDGSDANETVGVRLLDGGNVVTLFQVKGEPWVDAFVVEQGFSK